MYIVIIEEFFEQLEENGNVVHEVCCAQMTYFDYNRKVCPINLLSPRNALRWGYSNAAVVPCVCASLCTR